MKHGAGQLQVDELRKEVDRVHEELRDLLIKRRDLTMQIWKIKVDQELPFVVPQREEEILRGFSEDSRLDADPEFKHVLSKIMSSVLMEFRAYLFNKNNLPK